MENKINIAKLLKDCPSNMELDCAMFDDIYFDYVDRLNIIHCYIQYETHKTSLTFNQYGTFNSDVKSKCLIFPKGKTTWEGFQRPFKDGDIVAVTMIPEGIWIGIFKQYEKTTFESHCSLSTIGEFNSKGFKNHSLIGLRFATEEEKQKLFAAIKDNGYKWNPQTKTLEKFPKFKVGDKIVDIYKKHLHCDSASGKISQITDDKYIFDDGSYIHIQCQDNWELVPNKFDITTLVPFESRVLVRSSDGDIWRPAIYGVIDSKKHYHYVVGGNYWIQCIPFEPNKELLGTTDDCGEYFKTWE